ncbi:MAG TPA: hypothetical protein VMW81_08505 [Nitrospinota bacterium]|nr:hypothetical protein [Nitrospinota bacterium]
MSLQDQLNSLKATIESKVSKDALAIMHKATEELRDSGIMEKTLKVGDKAPDFSLKNAEGNVIGSKDLLEKGHLVITFYRGKW